MTQQKENELAEHTPVEADLLRGIRDVDESSFNISIPGLRVLLNSLAQTFINLVTFNSGIKTDTIAEKTGSAGVTIDGVLLKDGGVAGTIQTSAQPNVTSLGIFSKDLNQGGFELINSKTISEIQRGKGLHFNGVDQDVSIADDPNVDLGIGDFSILLLIRVDTPNAQQNIIQKGSATETYFVQISLAGLVIFYMQDSGALVSVESDIAINDNRIHAIVCRSDRDGNMTITIDGVLQSNTTASATGTLSSSEPLYFGRNNGGSQRFKGELYTVLFFNRLLTDVEAKSWSSNPLKQLEFKDIGGSQVAQTSGALIPGKTYRTDLFIAGDDFSNVANIGASANVTGAVWTAIGITPTVWTNSSELIKEGCIAEYRPDSIKSESNTWYDKQNGNNGVIDADVINDDLVSIDNTVEAVGSFTASHKAIIKIDGVLYKMQLDEV